MDENKIKELLMILRIYLSYRDSEDNAQKQNLRTKLTNMVNELLPE